MKTALPENDGAAPAAADPRLELAKRVAASPLFRRSHRMQELLLFLCERAIRDPGTVLKEQEIGIAVFGRSAEFDTSHDTLVRVQASQLRKRLQQYFSGEGADEGMIIEIPKGSYLPVFRAPDGTGQHHRARANLVRTLVLLGALAIAVGCSLWLAVENRRLSRRLSAGLEPRPAVDELWRQMFANGRHTYLVLADANLTLFQDLIRYQLSPNEYQRRQFNALAAQRLKDPLSRDFAARLMYRDFTSLADAGLARRIGLLTAAHGVATEVVLARNADASHFKSHNAVLSGPRRANPWLALFEERLNFRSRYDEETPRALIDNVSPRPGEQSTYVVDWNRTGFCRVAYLPNLDATGSILIISGTEMSSSEAGTEFITSERWVRQLRTALGVGSRAVVPHFEVLLRTQLVIGAAPSFEMLAWRVVEL